MSPEQAEQWTQLADEANVCLENEIFRKGFEEAENRYVELKKALPNEILPFRNHAILRILRFKSDDDLKNDEAFIEETFKIMEELLEKDPDAYQSYILAVRSRTLCSFFLNTRQILTLSSVGSRTFIEIPQTAVRTAVRASSPAVCQQLNVGLHPIVDKPGFLPADRKNV